MATTQLNQRKAAALQPRRGRPPTGRAQSASERMRRYRERQRDAGLRAETRYQPAATFNAGALKHRIIEMRSLAIHCLVAQKIEGNPRLLNQVKQTLDGWLTRYGDKGDKGDEVPRALTEWRTILRAPWPNIAALITSPGERSTRLRQSTPFASLLTAEERERIYAAFRV